MVRPRTARAQACPFINRDDPRCAHRFRLSRVREAFEVCLNAPTTCPNYHQLMGEQQRDRRQGPNPAIHLTIRGARAPLPHRTGAGTRTGAASTATAPAGERLPV